MWHAVHAEAEVLDMLVQSKRNKHATLKPVRKLLKNMPSFRSAWSRTTCGPIAPRLAIWASSTCMSANDGTTIGRRIRISRPNGGGARATVQEPGSSPEIPLNSRRRLQHFQRPAASRLCSNAAHLSSRGDEHVARDGHCWLKLRKLWSRLAPSSTA